MKILNRSTINYYAFYIFLFLNHIYLNLQTNIVSKTSIDIEFRKTWLNWRILIIGGRIWWLYWVSTFRYEIDDLFPIRMNVRFFIINLSSIMVLDLDIMISTLLNSHGLINITHLSLAIEIDVIPLSRIRPHVFIIDKKNTIFKSK